jgi:Uma2 family endonuclease
MAGGTPEHGAIAANIIALLATQLRERPCRVFTSDVRIRVKATGLATYPDVTVICGAQQADPDDASGSTLLNPQVLVEVPSPSTDAYDRGEKLDHYKQIISLREIVLVAHEEQRVESWRRGDDDWAVEVVQETGTVLLRSLACRLPLSEVYRNPFALKGP